MTIHGSRADGRRRDQEDVRVLDVASVRVDLYPALRQEHHPKGRCGWPFIGVSCLIAYLFLTSSCLPGRAFVF